MNGHYDRLWKVIAGLVAILLSLLGWFVQHELNLINSRLDRIADYVLEARHELKLPPPPDKP